MSVLVLAEHDQGHLFPATAHLVGAASLLGDVVVLVVGAGCQGVAEEAAVLHSVVEVLWADHPALAHGLPENLAPLAQEIMTSGRFSHLLASASPFGRDLLPRIAAGMGLSPLAEVIAIHGPTTFVRPIHAGQAEAILEALSSPILLTVRPSAFSPVGIRMDSVAPLREVKGRFEESGLSQFIAFSRGSENRPELLSSRVVVAGGAGVGGVEQFALVEQLADRLGAAVGATRAAVDAGLAPNAWQIGQTGKSVAPLLYIGLGISGAIQHLAGIKDARFILAINRDPQAPIFSVADAWLVAELEEAIPALLAALEQCGSIAS